MHLHHTKPGNIWCNSSQRDVSQTCASFPKWRKFRVKNDLHSHMSVSKNRGTPKSSILTGFWFSIINHPVLWFPPYFWNTHIVLVNLTTNQKHITTNPPGWLMTLSTIYFQVMGTRPWWWQYVQQVGSLVGGNVGNPWDAWMNWLFNEVAGAHVVAAYHFF